MHMLPSLLFDQYFLSFVTHGCLKIPPLDDLQITNISNVFYADRKKYFLVLLLCPTKVCCEIPCFSQTFLSPFPRYQFLFLPCICCFHQFINLNCIATLIPSANSFFFTSGMSCAAVQMLQLQCCILYFLQEALC